MQLSIGKTKLMLSLFILLPWRATMNVNAQILPAQDGTGTTTQQDLNQINISGGQTSQGGGNLFHSFSQFNVNPSQVANFISAPNVQNILGKIDGSNPSFINGTLQVSGGNANLFLMNPAGFVFGANASLNLPASFTTTTATGINFANGQFSAIGNNDYTNLVGNPTAFMFGSTQPGAIVNGGNLTVKPGQNIDLIGGTVISTGTVNAPNGNINIAAVPGTSLVRISQPGNLLSLDVPISGTTNFTPVSLPGLLTGSDVPGVTVTGNNITLDRTNTPINSGDVVVNRLNSGTATVAANNNLYIFGGNLQTTGDATLRAQDTVAIRDTQQNPVNIVVDGRLLIQGDRAIDIFALNNPTTNISASGDLTLRSSTTVGGDAYFNTGGNFKIEQLDGKPGGLFSPYDPIIRASGDVSFASYDGASLHIIAGGSVTTGNINITGADTSSGTYDISTNTSKPNGLQEPVPIRLANGREISIDGINNPTLDIRAGVNIDKIGTTGNSGSFQRTDGSSFVPNTPPLDRTGSAITIGNVNFIRQPNSTQNANRPFVFLTNQYEPNPNLIAGDITVNGTIDARASSPTGTQSSRLGAEDVSGDITIVGRNKVTVNGLTTTSFGDFISSSSTNTGNILVETTGNILSTGLISTENPNPASTGSGNISLTSTNGTITTNAVVTTGSYNRAGDINITAAGAIDTTKGDFLDTRFTTPVTTGISGNIKLTSNNSGTISVANLLTNGGAIDITGKGDVNVVQLNTGNNGGNSPNSGNITVSTTGDILATGSIINVGGNITLTSANGKVTTDEVRTLGNQALDIKITAAGEIDTTRGDLSTRSVIPQAGIRSGSINLTSTTNGNISVNNLSTAGGAIDITGKGNVNIVGLATGVEISNIRLLGNITVNTTDDILATGLITTQNNLNGGSSGNVNLTSTNGKVTTDRISTQLGGLGNNSAGNVNISAANAIVIRDVQTGSTSPNRVTGGNIGLISTNSSIETGNLSTRTIFGNSGNVSATAKTNINTGNIVTNSNSGNGGNVTLASGNNIGVGYIDTSARINGGLIDITAPGFFRATGIPMNPAPTSLPSASPSPVPASIYSNGTTASGAITIRHGGNGITPFIVGDDAPANGTKGAIVSSNNNQINPTQSFFPTYTQGNIQIITQPKLPAACPPSCPQPPVTSNPPTTTNQPPKTDTPDDRIANNFPGLQQYNSSSTTIGETQEILHKIETSTGVKPAIIYVVFSPPNLDVDVAKDLNNISNLARDSFQLELIMVTPSGVSVRKKIPITRQKLIAVAKKFRTQVSTIDPKNPTAFLPSAQQLYQWLIAPLEPDLQKQKIKNLVFITDSGLRALPVAALHDGKQFLVERYSVGSMPSISLTDTRYVDIRNAKVLAMGAENTPDQKPLPAVPIELKTISGTIWTGKSLENDDFTATKLVSQRQQQPYGILHLATHGDFKSGGPENSYIQFKNEKIGLDRLRQLKLNDPPVELMVLSACRTAVGDEDAELGFAGLANRAGVKSAMGSIWYVSDEGTLGLMTSFYRNLKTAPIKAEALRQAQVDMLKGKVRLQNGKLVTPGDNISLPPNLVKLGNVNLMHPFYWSGFTIVGSPW